MGSFSVRKGGDDGACACAAKAPNPIANAQAKPRTVVHNQSFGFNFLRSGGIA
jgi:hypothetical protein